jgi:Protein of unknown function (DUF2785)
MPQRQIALDADSLEAISAACYAVPPGITPGEVLSGLVENLGSPRSDVRELSFSVLGEWIGRGLYADDELKDLTGVLTANLEVGIGEEATDSVFIRSFSALVLGKIVDRDTAAPFFAADYVHAILVAALAFLRNERDLRAFTPDKGWIHTAAHAGDLLAALAKNPHLGEEELKHLVGGIAAKMQTYVDHVYLRFEDERLSYAVVSALRRGVLSEEFWSGWIDGLSRPAGASSWGELIEGSESEVSAWHNTRDFLRTLYLQLRLGITPPGLAASLLPRIEEALRSMDQGFYAP